MKQTYDVPEKAVVELEQLSLNDVQQTIEERQKKKTSYTIEKRAAKKYCKLRVVASKRKLKDGTTPELRRDIGRNRIVYTARSWMSFILNENLQLHFIQKQLLNCRLQIWWKVLVLLSLQRKISIAARIESLLLQANQWRGC